MVEKGAGVRIPEEAKEGEWEAFLKSDAEIRPGLALTPLRTRLTNIVFVSHWYGDAKDLQKF